MSGHGARVLHVAALPFPSHQGTQAALRSMLEHSVRAGRAAHLFTYAAGAQLTGEAPSFPLHRSGRFPRVSSLRSGPSLGKLVLDARMLLELRALERRLAPDVIVAHHVEAAALALASARAPVVFFAHTDLEAELPTYAPEAAAPWLSRAGALLDATLARRARAVATISPLLRERFAQRLDGVARRVAYVPTPWIAAEPSSADERARSRQGLGLAQDAQVLLYAGNLDAYQGLDTLLAACATLARRDPKLVLLVATESDSAALRGQVSAAGLAGRLVVTTLAGDAARRRAHAAADLAVVPRLSPGGLPIKLLDALARGLPCAVVPRACAGLALSETVAVAASDEPGALAHAIQGLLASTGQRDALTQAGSRYLAREHAPRRFLSALDSVIASARGTTHEPG